MSCCSLPDLSVQVCLAEMMAKVFTVGWCEAEGRKQQDGSGAQRKEKWV